MPEQLIYRKFAIYSPAQTIPGCRKSNFIDARDCRSCNYCPILANLTLSALIKNYLFPT